MSLNALRPFISSLARSHRFTPRPSVFSSMILGEWNQLMSKEHPRTGEMFCSPCALSYTVRMEPTSAAHSYS